MGVTGGTAAEGGYEVDDIYELTFVNRGNAKIVARGIDCGTMLLLMAQREDASRTGLDWTTEGFRWLAGALESWNLTRKGVSIPATHDGLMSLGFGFSIQILNSWMDVQVAVPVPLGEPSSGGESARVVLPTMELL